MSAAKLLLDLDRLGIRLEARGEQLQYHPRSALPPELLGRLKTHKGELLVLIERRSERAAIVEFDGNPQPEPLFPPWVIEALREATLSIVGPGDGLVNAEAEAPESDEAPAMVVAADGWPAGTVDPSAVAACSKCGGMELWETAEGTWRCLKCEPPTTSRRIVSLAERIRKQKKPKAEAAPNAGCPCGSTTWRDTDIHGGKSTRRNCARCGRFLSFPVWYGEG